jgi:hypothetical protein
MYFDTIEEKPKKSKRKKKSPPQFKEGLCEKENCSNFATLYRFRCQYICLDCFLHFDPQCVQDRVDALTRGPSGLARLQNGESGDGPAFRVGGRRGKSR